MYEQEESLRTTGKIRGRDSRRLADVSETGSVHDSRKKMSSVETTDSSPAVSFRRMEEHLSSHLFALLPEHRLLFSCGHWDYSFKVSSVDSGKIIQSVSLHRSVVTCIALACEFGNTWIVTGSRDCTVMVWKINPFSEHPVDTEPIHVLYGHDDSVNSVCVNCELDIVVSGSDDSTIIVHSLRTGTYIRSLFVSSTDPTKTVVPLEPEASTPTTIPADTFGGEMILGMSSASPLKKCRVHWVGVSVEGYIVAYSSDDCALYSFTINGAFLARKIVGDNLHAFCFSEDNKVLITGGERGLIVMRHVYSLELSNYGSKYDFDAVIDGSCAEYDQGPFNSPIRSIYLTKQEKHMLVGLENGYMRVLAQVTHIFDY
jgi:WD40 repeat protein